MSSSRALRGEVRQEEDGVLVEDAEDPNTVRDAAGEEDVGEEALEELRRRGEEAIAVQGRCTEDDRRVAVELVGVRRGEQRADLLEERQLERQRGGGCKEGRDVERLEDERDVCAGIAKGGDNGALCVGKRKGWPIARRERRQ